MSLLTNVFLCKGSTDYCIWKPSYTYLYSSRLFYKEIDPFNIAWSPCASVWMGLAPPRMEAFCWLAMVGKISIAYNLRSGRIPFHTCLLMREGDGANRSLVLELQCNAVYLGGLCSKNAASGGVFLVL